MNRKIWIGAAVLVPLLLIFLGQALKVADLAAIQNTVERNWEISYGYYDGPDKPAFLPSSLNDAAFEYFDRIYPETHDDTIYRERFRAFFRGSIQEISVYDFETLKGDLGAALLRIRSLRHVTVYSGDPTESEWSLLCSRLRELPRLEELEIGGYQLTDRSIAQLAGHPRLQRISIIAGRVTVSSARTFSTLPKLTHLSFEEQGHEGDTWITPEQKAEMAAALPGVQIDFR